MPKGRYTSQIEMDEIIRMFESGDTVAEIIEKTGRHSSVVSKALRNAPNLSRPFKTKPRILFDNDEIRLMRELAAQGLSASEIAARMPGRRKETINGKLKALGYDRSLEISSDKRRMVLDLKEEGYTIREIAEITKVPRSTVSTINSMEVGERADPAVMRRVIDGNLCRIYSADRKHEFVVDAADFDILPQSSIYKGSGGYPICRVNGVTTYLHHVIMGPPRNGMMVDHINGNRLDNRRANLRWATARQNTQNSIRGTGPSGLHGVRKTKTGYAASIVLTLGPFDTAEEAARAYDAKVIELYGEHAMTNEKRGFFTKQTA